MNKQVENDFRICMTSILGKYVKEPDALPFSFYFSSHVVKEYPISVRPVFDPERLFLSLTGYLKLCDDWEYIPGKNDRNTKEKDIESMKQFFKENIVLFAMVWDEQLQDGVLEYYFTGLISFHETLQNIDFYKKYKLQMDKLSTVKELETFCRENNLVNFYGN